MSHIPEDVNHRWFAVIRRVQSIVQEHKRQKMGMIRIQLSVIVDCNGIPLMWDQPTATTLEPREIGERICEVLTDR